MSKIRIPLNVLMFVAVFVTASASGQTLPNGVAAGDVDQTSAVLWARSSTLGAVSFSVSRETSLPGEVVATFASEVVDPLQPVKAEFTGLSPGEPYSYVVTDAAGTQATGRFRTPHADGFHGLRFGASGDWRGELRPYPAIGNVPARDLDLFVGLGDTIYADYASIDFPRPQARTLDEFRIKHNEVYSERLGMNTWAAARASTALLVCIDDHEVTNDFAGGAAPESDARFEPIGEFINETELYDRGLQAFHEFNPIREEYYGETGDPRTSGKRKLYRYRTYGADAAFFLLDARSFRDEALEGVEHILNRRENREFIEDSFDSSRTMLGAAQLEELKTDLLDADLRGITWKFILVPEPIQNLGPVLASDRFEGYHHERSQLLSFIDQNDITNAVFVAADIHGTIVNDLAYRMSPRGREHRLEAFEITTGPVAFEEPLGPTAIARTPRFIRNFYEGIAGQRQNRFIQGIGSFLLDFLGYSRIGLARSLVSARLIRGGYVAVNHYGWTEFEIDADTQDLRVTTYGVDWYSADDLLTDPEDVIDREPRIVSQFCVQAELDEAEETALGESTCRAVGSRCGVVGGWFWITWGLLWLVFRMGTQDRRRVKGIS